MLAAEIADRQDTIDLYTHHGRPREASELRGQIQVLAAYLD